MRGRSASRRPVGAVLAALLLATCTGQISEPRGTMNQPSRDAGRNTCEAVPRAPLRRLTHTEYDNTVRDLLGDTSHPARAFPTEHGEEGFSNQAVTQTVSPLLAEGYFNAAEALATRAAADLPALMGCNPAAGDEPGCARRFVESFGRRAFRRPLTGAEVTDYVGMYTATRAEATAAVAAATVVHAMMVSPHFLYVVELGGAPDGPRVPLTSYEMASRLSYFYWQSMPDAELFAAAERDALRTPAQVAAQARRLLADERARAAAAAFMSEWLGLRGVESAERSDEAYPEFTREVRAAMAEQARAFVDHVLWQDGGRLETLLTAPYGFVNETLAPLYGLRDVRGSEFRLVSLDPTQRAGVLTLLAVLTATGAPGQSDPIARGKFVRTRLLCQTLPEPPPGLMPVAPEPTPTTSTRQRFEQHRRDPACASCHRMMDPIGFGFEHYDAIGRYRTTDGTHEVDAAGELLATRDADGPFRGVPELARRLAQSAEVRDCAVTRWFQYAMGRAPVAADDCSLAQLRAAFEASNHDLRELMVAVSQTEAFLTRGVQ